MKLARGIIDAHEPGEWAAKLIVRTQEEESERVGGICLGEEEKKEPERRAGLNKNELCSSGGDDVSAPLTSDYVNENGGDDGAADEIL